jgi:hypothetical protein
MYALDSDGNIVRLLTPTFSIDDSDELAKARTKRFFADVEKLTRSRDDK